MVIFADLKKCTSQGPGLLHRGVLCYLGVLYGVENEYESCCKSQKMILKLLFLKNMMSLGLCKNKQIY